MWGPEFKPQYCQKIKILSSVNRVDFISSCPVWRPFICFSCLILWWELPERYWRAGEVGLLASFLASTFSLSPPRMSDAAGFALRIHAGARQALWRHFLLSFVCWEFSSFFNLRLKFWSYVKGFFCIYWEGWQPFALWLRPYIHRCACVEPSLHSRRKSCHIGVYFF
jgi:hypothetical protein